MRPDAARSTSGIMRHDTRRNSQGNLRPDTGSSSIEIMRSDTVTTKEIVRHEAPVLLAINFETSAVFSLLISPSNSSPHHSSLLMLLLLLLYPGYYFSFLGSLPRLRFFVSSPSLDRQTDPNAEVAIAFILA